MLWFSQEADVKTETLFFDDGRRRIDFVLVYKDTKDGNKAQHRRHFEDNLINEGIEIEVEDKEVWQFHSSDSPF